MGNGELLFDEWSRKFIDPIPELSDSQKEDAKESYIREMGEYWKNWDDLNEEERENWYQRYAQKHGLISEDAKTYGAYFDNEYYDTYAKDYTTKSGDNIVIFGYYGHD